METARDHRYRPFARPDQHDREIGAVNVVEDFRGRLLLNKVDPMLIEVFTERHSTPSWPNAEGWEPARTSQQLYEEARITKEMVAFAPAKGKGE
jgi:hypothetical protein